ncbi:MAG: hypothetical protein ACF8OB_03395 [Phycisphaeraceae bacterium JB051]
MNKTLITTMLSCLILVGLSNFAKATYYNDNCKYDGNVVVRDSAASSGYYLSGTKDTDLQVEKKYGGYNNISTGTLNLDIREKTNPGSDPASWYNFQAYCLEMNQTAKFGTNPTDTYGWGYETSSLAGYAGISSSDLTFLGKLWANAFETSMTGDVEAAAFQALIWETVQDSTIDLDDDNFDLYRTNNFTKDVYALANEWIDNINNGIWTDTVELFVLTDDCSQDFITTVPEPSSMALALVGGLMLLGRGRRQRIA